MERVFRLGVKDPKNRHRPTHQPPGLVDITCMTTLLPAAPDLLETSPGRVLVELHPEGLDLLVELGEGGTEALVTWWGAEVRRVPVGRA